MRVYRIVLSRGWGQTGSLIICEGISELNEADRLFISFPHYMWGYIISPLVLCILIYVPSLYVRVYRHIESRHPGRVSSLIICEGISPVRTSRASHNGFPHYMWGYIANFQPDGKTGSVPSLYVRVYRLSYRRCRPHLTFPHYMWGYIEQYIHRVENQDVPSLYVRVYRSDLLRLWFQNRSLIICEGISVLCISHNSEAAFPHYMWGYICYTSIW